MDTKEKDFRDTFLHKFLHGLIITVLNGVIVLLFVYYSNVLVEFFLAPANSNWYFIVLTFIISGMIVWLTQKP